MDDNKFQIDVLTRLTAIETLLKEQDYKAVNERLNQAENMANNNKDRLDKIEDNTRWLWRTVGVSIITVVIGSIVAFIKMS